MYAIATGVAAGVAIHRYKDDIKRLIIDPLQESTLDPLERNMAYLCQLIAVKLAQHLADREKQKSKPFAQSARRGEPQLIAVKQSGTDSAYFEGEQDVPVNYLTSDQLDINDLIQERKRRKQVNESVCDSWEVLSEESFDDLSIASLD
ncbi:BA75_02247T0 [Komagataella pastoris]|uniref:BA75_02247T0 n=1 Tax=Komagataella pastoris TaxID=4922 RepID=A0A1B2JDE4_PICPA|nr:BA75_02247T0 [Komagataella pastoris]